MSLSLNKFRLFNITKRESRRTVVQTLVDANEPFAVKFVKQNKVPRVLLGTIIGPSHGGYIHVKDLERETGDRHRQVDTRTIEYVILEGIKHVVK